MIRLPMWLQQNRSSDSWEYINRLQMYECGNWEQGRAVWFLGIYIIRIFFAVQLTVLILTSRTLEDGKDDVGSKSQLGANYL